MNDAHYQTLLRALQLVGTKERLATALALSAPELEDYLSRKKSLSHPVYLRALNIPVSSGD